MHSLVIGRTLSGKSSLAKSIGSDLREKGIYVIAFNPTLEAGYTVRDEYGMAAADVEYDDKEEFIDAVREKINDGQPFIIIVDEAHEFWERAGSREYLWLARKGRHFGVNIIAITQRGADIHPTLRSQCGRLYLFQCSLTDAKFMSDEYGKKVLRDAPNMNPGEYYRIEPNSLERCRLF